MTDPACHINAAHHPNCSNTSIFLVIWVCIIDQDYQGLCPGSSTLCLSTKQAAPKTCSVVEVEVVLGGWSWREVLGHPQLSPPLLWVSYQMLLLDLEGANTSGFL